MKVAKNASKNQQTKPNQGPARSWTSVGPFPKQGTAQKERGTPQNISFKLGKIPNKKG